ncbi:MAG: hypothetical protein AVDCRST_MAG88-410 [uncultured Thermomicrobiales bacterium]|uniref:Uncharacterized protein n=1 Tax=uncultured Thermomicrobiales bacterium TaxID=1645740 RepID=A0A6J4UFM8_9BACT|nr:MAG: hypothetical protein AVDCRST_MAG88-410 [uncultured Thermomicrobiales bacterium]
MHATMLTRLGELAAIVDGNLWPLYAAVAFSEPAWRERPAVCRHDRRDTERVIGLMAASEIGPQSSTLGRRLPRAVAILGGVGLVALGAWAMIEPRSFFDALATFEPYNQHFLQDIGAFQAGLGAVLLLASVPARADGLAVALIGVGAGAALHAVSHVVGRDLGGTPATDIPSFAALAVLLLAAGGFRRRHVRGLAR